MRQYADIFAFDKNGQLALIAEVKNKRGTSSDWAAKMRRNMYAHGYLPEAPYFLLALPDKFYLWKNAGSAVEALEPTQQFDPKALLQQYYDKFGISTNGMAGTSFEMIVVLWLNRILDARNPEELYDGEHELPIDSELFNTLQGGRIELDAAA